VTDPRKRSKGVKTRILATMQHTAKGLHDAGLMDTLCKRGFDA
jgi:hypothetical protein